MFATVSWFFGSQAIAQKYNIVQIRAYDSKGVFTGRCMATRPDASVVLDTCVATNQGQLR